MANTHKFIVKNGLRADNIEFTDSQSGSHQITLSMLNSDTLNFEGDAGSLFSIEDDLTGSVFSVSDISGLPIIDANGDTHNVTLNQFDGKTMIGGTDSGSTDSDVLNVTGNIRSTGLIVTDSATFGGNGATSGITLNDGQMVMRTGNSIPAYIDLYCEVNNIHRVRLQSPAHSNYSGNPNVTLPNVTGTILTDSSTATLLNKTFDANGTGNNISNIDIGNMTAAVIVTETEGIGSNDNDTTLPTSAAVKDYVDNNAGGGGVSSDADNNTAGGSNALNSLTSGQGLSNTAFGKDAGTNITTGDNNTFVGFEAGASIDGGGSTTSTKNVAIGNQVMKLVSGTDVATFTNNIAIGHQVMYNYGTFGSTITNNIGIGNQALYAVRGTDNIAIGKFAGSAISSGTKNLVLGAYNGNSGGLDIRTQSNNIVLSDGDGNVRLHINSSGVPQLAGLNYPTSDGNAGQVLQTDGGGNLSFASVSGGGGSGGGNAFKTISVSGQSDVVADDSADTLTLVAGSNMTITTNAGGDTITFASSGGGGGGITTGKAIAMAIVFG